MSNLGFHCHSVGHIEPLIISNGLRRGEFYNLPAGDLPSLREKVERYNLAVSIHTPLVKTEWYPDPPTWAFLCDVEKEKRELNLRLVRETMERAGDFEAEYVVVHFPSPPSSEPVGVSYEELRGIAEESAYLLARLVEEYGIPVYLESFGPSPFLNVEFITQVLTRFPRLRYCFDSGHMHLAALRDGFDLYQFAERLAPYLGAIHLWNTRSFEDYLAFRHIPIHPCQGPEGGWADIPRILQAIKPEASCPVIFESGFRYPTALGGHDYREGVEWIKQIMATLS